MRTLYRRNDLTGRACRWAGSNRWRCRSRATSWRSRRVSSQCLRRQGHRRDAGRRGALCPQRRRRQLVDPFRAALLLARQPPTRRRRSWRTRGSTSSCRAAIAIRSTRSGEHRGLVSYDAYDLLVRKPATRSAIASPWANGMRQEPRRAGQRLPRPAAAPGDRPERQPRAVELRCAGDGGGHGGHGQARRDAASRRLARRLRCRICPTTSSLAHLADPLADPHAILRARHDAARLRSVRLSPHQRAAEPAPAVVYTLARETHDADLAAGRANEDPAQLLLLRRLRPRDPEEGPGRAGPVPQRDAPRADHHRRRSAGADGRAFARAGSAAAGPSSTTRASRSASSSRSSPTRTASSSTSASA